MAKHGKETKKNKSIIIIILVVIFSIGLIIYFISNKNIQIARKNETVNTNSIKTSQTIEEQKLVFKSTSDYNRIIEYAFENNILKTIKIYQQFETDEELQKQKEMCLGNEQVTVLNINEKEKSIEIEKKDLGADKELSYDEICDKYLVQIIGAYEKI